MFIPRQVKYLTSPLKCLQLRNPAVKFLSEELFVIKVSSFIKSVSYVLKGILSSLSLSSFQQLSRKENYIVKLRSSLGKEFTFLFLARLIFIPEDFTSSKLYQKRENVFISIGDVNRKKRKSNYLESRNKEFLDNFLNKKQGICETRQSEDDNNEKFAPTDVIYLNILKQNLLISRLLLATSLHSSMLTKAQTLTSFNKSSNKLNQ